MSSHKSEDAGVVRGEAALDMPSEVRDGTGSDQVMSGHEKGNGSAVGELHVERRGGNYETPEELHKSREQRSSMPRPLASARAESRSGPETQQVVLTHGYGSDSSTWARQVPVLAERFTTVTWDLRAHGRTPVPTDGRFDREAALDDLVSVIDGEPSVLVGHSFGGYLSLLAAITRPERVRGLVLISTGPGFRKQSAREAWNDFARRASAAMRPPPEAAEMLLQHDALVIDNLNTVTVPVLHIVGEKDTQFHAGHSYMQESLPDAQAVMIERAGHHPQRTSSQEVNAELVAFLNRLASCAPNGP